MSNNIINRIDEASDSIVYGSIVKQVVDQFVRFLIGDKKVAISSLEKLMNKKIFSGPLKLDDKEYNVLYENLFKSIKKAIVMNIEK